jgi:membrane-associated protease RseP (regulator of RpoE activity)
MGGYVGRTSFVVVADYGRILFAELDIKPGGMIAEQCTAAQRAGLLPPLSATDGSTEMSVGSPTTAPPSVDAATGLTLRAMPDGAYISAVSPTSAAARTGLKPGMVISSVNAIPLAGMGDAMLKVVGAAGPDATLTLVGGTSVKLGARP